MASEEPNLQSMVLEDEIRALSEISFSKEEISMVLFGSTGQGKSALGNFLVDPTDFDSDNQTFPVGETNVSCTSTCKLGGKSGIHVMDTPGINDSRGDKHDLGHMIEVVETLHRLEKVHACVLVAKYDARLDRQWMETVKYYRDLLGKQTFEENLVVVLNQAIVKQRSKKSFGDRKSENIAEVKKRVKEDLGLSVEPQVFVFDAMPDDHPREHFKESLKVRSEFLQYVSEQRPVSVKGLQVPKTPPLLSEDRKLAGRIDGRLEEQKKRLIELKGFPDTVKNELAEFTERKERLQSEVNERTGKIQETDSQELMEIPGTRWNHSADWELGQNNMIRFNIKTSSPIRHRSPHYSKDNYNLISDHISEYQYTGLFEKRTLTLFTGWKSLEVKVFSWKRDIFAPELKRMHDEVTQKEQAIDDTKMKIFALQEKYPLIMEPSQNLESEIRNLEAERVRLQSSCMTVEEAKERHGAMRDDEPRAKL